MVVSSLKHDRRHGQGNFADVGPRVGMSQFDDPYPAIPHDPYSVPDANVGIDLDYLAHLLKLCTAWLFGTIIVVSIALVIWRLRSPVTYERYFGRHARQARWMLWSLTAWRRIARDSGLSTSRSVTRKDMQGKPTTKTEWTHPEILGIRMSGHCLHMSVRTRSGQTFDDLEKAVPAIRDAVGAHSGRSTIVAPGTVRMEFVMTEQLSTVETAKLPYQKQRDRRRHRPVRKRVNLATSHSRATHLDGRVLRRGQGLDLLRYRRRLGPSRQVGKCTAVGHRPQVRHRGIGRI